MAPTGPRNPADDPETTTTQLYSLTFRFKGTRKPLVNQQKKYIALQRTSAQHQIYILPRCFPVQSLLKAVGMCFS